MASRTRRAGGCIGAHLRQCRLLVTSSSLIIRLFCSSLDELTSAERDVFGVAYQFINERRVGEHILMPNVRIVARG